MLITDGKQEARVRMMERTVHWLVGHITKVSCWKEKGIGEEIATVEESTRLTGIEKEKKEKASHNALLSYSSCTCFYHAVCQQRKSTEQQSAGRKYVCV